MNTYRKGENLTVANVYFRYSTVFEQTTEHIHFGSATNTDEKNKLTGKERLNRIASGNSRLNAKYISVSFLLNRFYIIYLRYALASARCGNSKLLL